MGMSVGSPDWSGFVKLTLVAGNLQSPLPCSGKGLSFQYNSTQGSEENVKDEKIPLFLRKPIFVKVFQIGEYCNLTKEEKEMYDVELKRKWDRANILVFKQ